jgi:ABC-2 type transport system ATP-binding protein
MKDAFLDVDNVSLALGGQALLSDVSLTASPGDVLGIIGRNGSGKSMLFKCIAGLVVPQAGEIRVDGFGVVSQRRFPPRMGALIEKPGFIGSLTAFANLDILASIQGVIGKPEILDAMREVGLEDVANKRVRKFSLGMKQRLGIAQAIMEHPKLLILDEPTSGLDTSGVEMLRKLVGRLSSEGTTILIASHLAEDIDVLCNRTLRMERGALQPL